MAGKPDHVGRHDGQLRVVDYKFGLQQAEPSAAQRQQLVFYAALVEHVLGETPEVGVISDATGREHVLPVGADSIRELREHAQGALAALRAAAVGDDVLEERAVEENCSICPYRASCSGFFDAYTADWRVGRVRAGRIVDILDLSGRLAVDVEVLAPSWSVGLMRLIGFPFPSEVQPGQVWAYSDFEGPGAAGLARWNTLVQRWS